MFEEWVTKNRLILPWEEASAFCEDERQQLIAINASGDVKDSVNCRATEDVFDAINELCNENIFYVG